MANKTLLIAQRELLENLRTKTFWFGILSFPLIFLVAIAIGWVMNKTKSLQQYAVLDFTPMQMSREVHEVARHADFQRSITELLPKSKPGATPEQPQPEPTLAEITAALDEAAAELAADSPMQSLIALLRKDPELLLQHAKSARGGKPGDVPPKLMQLAFQWVISLTPEQQRSLASLSSSRKYEHVSLDQLGIANLPRAEQVRQVNDMIKSGRLFAYFLLDNDPLAYEPAKPLDPKAAPDFVYVSNNLTDDSLSSWYADAATQVLRRLRIAKADIPSERAKWIQQPVRFKEDQIDPTTGATKAVDKSDKGNKFAPVVFVYLLWIAVFTAAQMLLTNTVEEKSTRIIEVLLSSVSPGELMAGKIWGIGAAGLTIVGSWIVFGVLGVWLAPKLVPAFGEYNLMSIVGDPLYLISFLAYFLTGYLLFAALLVAIGSVCNSLKEAQNLQQPVILLLMLPLFAMIPIVQEPNGLMARVFTYIPIYTPFAMMNRASGPPPLIEYVITSVIILVSVWLAFKAAGKIFRVGVLMTGNPPKLKEILSWLREK